MNIMRIQILVVSSIVSLFLLHGYALASTGAVMRAEEKSATQQDPAKKPEAAKQEPREVSGAKGSQGGSEKCDANNNVDCVKAWDSTTFKTFYSNPTGYASFGQVFWMVVDFILTIMIPIMALALVWVGFKMVINQDVSKIAENKNLLIGVIVGIFLVLAAKGLVGTVINSVNQITDKNSQYVVPEKIQ